ncbi:MAG TPA: DUF6134 family protein [Hyphomonadaceae bacterium]|nr:DUF6134 family protein [Hyphomonadaceae bacterium]
MAAIAFTLAFVAPAFAQVWKPTDGDRLVFDVFRDGSRFGTHSVSFSESGDTLTVDSDVELKVTLGPLTLFHYVHDVTERYTSERLISVAARTKRDGKWRQLAVSAQEGGFDVAGSAFRGLLAGVIIPSTHWNIAEMKQPAMFSTETGAVLPITVTDMGLERVKTGEGMIEARRYLVKSDITASFWYDASGRWVKCAFEAQGSQIDYVLRQIPT